MSSSTTPTRPPRPSPPSQPSASKGSVALSAATLAASKASSTKQNAVGSSNGLMKTSKPSSTPSPPIESYSGSRGRGEQRSPTKDITTKSQPNKEAALVTLKRFLGPLLKFYLYRERRKANRLTNRPPGNPITSNSPSKAPKPKKYKLGEIVECIKTCRRSFLSRWPHEVLGELLRQAHIRFCHDGEIIVYEDEPWWCSGVVIALAGQVKVMPSKQRVPVGSPHVPYSGDANIPMQPSQTIKGSKDEGVNTPTAADTKILPTPLVLTDDVVLTQGECRRTIAAVGFVDCVLINASWLIKFMFGSRMDPSLPRFLSSVDHAETLKEIGPLRLNIMAKQYPMTVPLLMRSWLLQCWYLSFSDLLDRYLNNNNNNNNNPFSPQSTNNPLSVIANTPQTTSSSPSMTTMGNFGASLLAKVAAKVSALSNGAVGGGGLNSPQQANDINTSTPQEAPLLAKTRAFLAFLNKKDQCIISSDTATPTPSSQSSIIMTSFANAMAAQNEGRSSVFTSGHYFVSSAAESHLSRLVPLLEPRSYFPGDVLVAAGQPLTAIYFIRRGTATVKAPSFSVASLSALGRRTPSSSPYPTSIGYNMNASLNASMNQNNQLVEEYTLEAGSVYGEWGCLFERTSSATVVAATMCDVWQLRQHTLQEWFNTVPDPATITQLIDSVGSNTPRFGIPSSTKSSASTVSHHVAVPNLTNTTAAPSMASSASTLAAIERAYAPTPPPVPGHFHVGLVSSMDVPDVKLFSSESQKAAWLQSVRQIVIGTATLKRELWWLTRLEDSLLARGEGAGDSLNESRNNHSNTNLGGSQNNKKKKDLSGGTVMAGSLQSILFHSLRKIPALEQVTDSTLRSLIASSSSPALLPQPEANHNNSKLPPSTNVPHPAIFLPSTSLTSHGSDESSEGAAPSTPMYVKGSSSSQAAQASCNNLPCDAFIVVLAGTVRSQTALAADGAPETSECGAVLGENALLPHRWYYSWQAVTLVEAWVFPIEGVVEHVVRHQGSKGKSTSIIQHAETVSSNALRDIEKRNGLRVGELVITGASSYVSLAMDLLASFQRASSTSGPLEGSINKLLQSSLHNASPAVLGSAQGTLGSSAASPFSSVLSRRRSSFTFANSAVFLLNQRPPSSFGANKYAAPDRQTSDGRLQQLVQLVQASDGRSENDGDFNLTVGHVEKMAATIVLRESLPMHPSDENGCVNMAKGEPDSFYGVDKPSDQAARKGSIIAEFFGSKLFALRKSRDHSQVVASWLKACKDEDIQIALQQGAAAANTVSLLGGSLNKSILGLSLLRVPIKPPLPPRPERLFPNTAGPIAGRVAGVGGTIVGADPVTFAPRSPADQRSTVTYQRQLAAANSPLQGLIVKETPLGTARSTGSVLGPAGNGPSTHSSPREGNNSYISAASTDIGNNSMLGNTSILLSRSIAPSVGPLSSSSRSLSPQQPPPRPATTSSLPSAAAIASMVLLPPVELLDDEDQSMAGTQQGSNASATKVFTDEESDFNNTARSDATSHDPKLLLRKDTTTPAAITEAIAQIRSPGLPPRSPIHKSTANSRSGSPGRTEAIIEKEQLETRRLTSVMTRDLKSAAPPSSGRASVAFFDRRLHSAYRGEQTPIADGIEEEHYSHAISVEGAIFKERRPTQADALWVLDDERFDMPPIPSRGGGSRYSVANTLMSQRGFTKDNTAAGFGVRNNIPLSVEAAGDDENPDYTYDDGPEDTTDIADDYLNEIEGGTSTLVLLVHVTKALIKHASVSVDEKNIGPTFGNDSETYQTVFAHEQSVESPTFSALGNALNAPFMNLQGGGITTTLSTLSAVDQRGFRTPVEDNLPALRDNPIEQLAAPSSPSSIESLLALHPSDQFVCRVLDAKGKVILRTPVADICSVAGMDEMDRSGSGGPSAKAFNKDRTPEVGITWSRCSAASFIVNVKAVLAELRAMENENGNLHLGEIDKSTSCFTVELRRCCRFNEESMLRLQAEDTARRAGAPQANVDSLNSTKKLSPLEADNSPLLPNAEDDPNVVTVEELNNTQTKGGGGRFYRKRGLSFTKAAEQSVASSNVIDEVSHDYFKSVLIACAVLRQDDLERASTGMRPLSLSLPVPSGDGGSPSSSLAYNQSSQSPLPLDPLNTGSNSASFKSQTNHSTFSTTSARGPKHIERLQTQVIPSPQMTSSSSAATSAGFLYLSFLVSRTTEKDVRNGSAAIRQYAMGKQQQRTTSAGRNVRSPSVFNFSGASAHVSVGDDEADSYAAAGIKGSEDIESNNSVSWGSGSNRAPGSARLGGYRFPTSASGVRGSSMESVKRVGSNTLKPITDPIRRTRQERQSMLESRRAVRANSLALGVADMPITTTSARTPGIVDNSPRETTSIEQSTQWRVVNPPQDDRRTSLLEEDDGLADSHLFPEGLVVQIHKCENLPPSAVAGSPKMLASSLTGDFNNSQSSPIALPPHARVRLLCEEESDLHPAALDTSASTSRPQSQAGHRDIALDSTTSAKAAVQKSVLVRTREVLCAPEAPNGSRSYDPSWDFSQASWVHDLSGAFADTNLPMAASTGALPPRVSVAFGNDSFSALSAFAGGGGAGNHRTSRARALIFVVEDAATGQRLGTAKIRISEMQMEGEASARRIPLDVSTNTTAAASPSSTIASLNATGNSFTHNATFVMGGRTGEYDTPCILISFAVLKATRVVPIDRTLLGLSAPNFGQSPVSPSLLAGSSEPIGAFLLLSIRQCDGLLDVDSDGTPGDPFVKMWVESHYQRRRSIDQHMNRVRREDLVLQTKMKKETASPSWVGNRLSDRVGIVALKLIDPLAHSGATHELFEGPPNVRLEVWDSTDAQWIDLIGLVKAPLDKVMSTLLPTAEDDDDVRGEGKGPMALILQDGLALTNPSLAPSNDNDDDAGQPVAPMLSLMKTTALEVRDDQHSSTARGTVSIEASLVVGGMGSRCLHVGRVGKVQAPILPQIKQGKAKPKERPPLPLSPTRTPLLPTSRKTTSPQLPSRPSAAPAREITTTAPLTFPSIAAPSGSATAAFAASIAKQAEVGEASTSDILPLGTSLGSGSTDNPSSPNKRRITPLAPIPSIVSQPLPTLLPSPTQPAASSSALAPTTKVDNNATPYHASGNAIGYAPSVMGAASATYGGNSLLAKVMGMTPPAASADLLSAPSTHNTKNGTLELPERRPLPPSGPMKIAPSPEARLPTPPATPSPAQTPRGTVVAAGHVKTLSSDGILSLKHYRTATDAFDEEEQPPSMVVSSPAPLPTETTNGNEASYATVGPEQEPATTATTLVDPPQSIRSLMRLPGMNLGVLSSALQQRK